MSDQLPIASDPIPGDAPQAVADASTTRERADPVVALLGLSSRPAEVVSISAGDIRLITKSPLVPGQATAIELATADRRFHLVSQLRVTWSFPCPDGYAVAGQFSKPLTADQLRAFRPGS